MPQDSPCPPAGVPPSPALGHPSAWGLHSTVGATLSSSVSSVYATRSSSACPLRGAAEVEEATPVGLWLLGKQPAAVSSMPGQGGEPQEAVATPCHQAWGPWRQEEPLFALRGS